MYSSKVDINSEPGLTASFMLRNSNTGAMNRAMFLHKIPSSVEARSKQNWLNDLTFLGK